MCNACGFHCCASDCFEACGCDHCLEPACWGLDPESDDDCDDDYTAYDEEGRAVPPDAIAVPSRFRCVAINPEGSGSPAHSKEAT